MVNHRVLTQQTFERLLSQMPKGKVLDAGCFNNCLQGWFEKLGYIWFGCDIQQGNEYGEIPKVFPYGEVVKCDMQKMPYAKESFDLIFACHSFEHVENPTAVLKEFKRVLMPEGKIFISMPVLCEQHVLNGDFDHISVLVPMQMKRLCKYTGLELETEFREPNAEYPKGDFDNQIYIIKKDPELEIKIGEVK